MRVWVRIGVVLSVIWFVGFGGWLWIKAGHYLSDLYGQCLAMSDANQRWLRLDDPQYDQKVAEIKSHEEACKDYARTFSRQRMDEFHSFGWVLILLFDAALLALFWVIVVSAGGFRLKT